MPASAREGGQRRKEQGERGERGESDAPPKLGLQLISAGVISESARARAIKEERKVDAPPTVSSD